MDMSEIKRARTGLGLTQADLAKMADVSQPFIARLESGKTEASFTKVQRVFAALEKAGKPRLAEGTKIRDIMSRSVSLVAGRENIRRAAMIMKSKGISQLPVTEKGGIVGCVTEADISHAIITGPEDILVKNVMKPPLPMLDIESNIDIIVSLLDYSPAVLITRKGRLTGIVSRADMLKLVRR